MYYVFRRAALFIMGQIRPILEIRERIKREGRFHEWKHILRSYRNDGKKMACMQWSCGRYVLLRALSSRPSFIAMPFHPVHEVPLKCKDYTNQLKGEGQICTHRILVLKE